MAVNRQKITIRIPVSVYRRLKIYAVARHVPVGTLISRYLFEAMKNVEEFYDFGENIDSPQASHHETDFT